MTDDIKMSLETIEIEYEDDSLFVKKEKDFVYVTVWQGGGDATIGLYKEDAETLTEWLLKALSLEVVRK